MATALEMIAAREQQIAAAADGLNEQIRTLSDQLRDLEAEAGDLAVARKVILALGEDEPTPTTRPGLPDNPSTSTFSPPWPTPRTRCGHGTYVGRWAWAPTPRRSKA